MDLNNIDASAKKITKYFDYEIIKKMNQEGQRRLLKDYNLIENFDGFFKKVLGEQYE